MAQPVAVRQHASRPSPLGVGTMVWLASELMFFSGLFAAWFTLRAAAGEWPPADAELGTLRAALFTVVLLGSSGTMQAGVWAIEHGDRARARRWIVATMVLALVFLGNQASEWLSLDFTPSTHAFGSIFYLLTGFHGIHVLGGVLAMGALLGRMAGKAPDPGAVPVTQVIGYYWHFVDVVWIGVFATVFLLR
ncbi:MAG: aa3-type cytochrome oxidase subunit III [Acidimicrobiales bacterium]